MTINAPAEPTLINGEPLEEIEDFTYLGRTTEREQRVSLKPTRSVKSRQELTRSRSRPNKTLVAFAQLQTTWKSNIYSLMTKLQLYNNM